MKKRILLLIIFALIFRCYSGQCVPDNKNKPWELPKDVEYIKQWKGIIVHHSGSENDTYESIYDRHVTKQGWLAIGYNFLINKKGEILKGRSLNMRGAHAKGNKWTKERNSTHIGICLLGENTFSKEQMDSLYQLCAELTKQFPITSIERHHENCPGKMVDVEKLESVILNGTKYVSERRF